MRAIFTLQNAFICFILLFRDMIYIHIIQRKMGGIDDVTGAKTSND